MLLPAAPRSDTHPVEIGRSSLKWLKDIAQCEEATVALSAVGGVRAVGRRSLRYLKEARLLRVNICLSADEKESQNSEFNLDFQE